MQLRLKIVFGSAQPFLQRYPGLPVQQLLSPRNIRTADFWIVFRQGFGCNDAGRFLEMNDLFGNFEHRQFLGIANVSGGMNILRIRRLP
jgi:hypothetical protein